MRPSPHAQLSEADCAIPVSLLVLEKCGRAAFSVAGLGPAVRRNAFGELYLRLEGGVGGRGIRMFGGEIGQGFIAGNWRAAVGPS